MLFQHRVGGPLLAVASVVAFALAAAPTQASPAVRLQSDLSPNPAKVHGARGMVPRVEHGQKTPVTSTASANPHCANCSPPLRFTQGAPVMGGSTGTPGRVTITPVYWAPAGYSFSSSYKSIVNGYLQNVAAASGQGSNVYSAGTQYYQQASGSPLQHIQYAISAGAEIDDSAAFPAQSSSGCIANSGFSACVSDLSLQSELRSRLQAGGFPIDDSHLYMVFFPSGVETCLGTGVASSSNQCSTNTYCAYHSGTVAPDFVYSNEPYPDLAHCTDPFNGAQSPNGDAEADAQISLISHEANESITDWAGAWYDANGYENGDECAYVYGLPLGSTGGTSTLYNQVIGSGKYYTQDEFSNEDYALGTGDLTTTSGRLVPGCVQREEPLVTSFSGPTSLNAGVSGAFDASASADPDNASAVLGYSWSWGDGSSASGVRASHTYAAAGNYSVALKVTGLDGAAASSVQAVTVTGPVSTPTPTPTPSPSPTPTPTPTPTPPTPPAPAWTSLGGVILSGPAATSWGPGRTDVFALGQDHGLWHRYRSDTTWSEWQSLGGYLTSDPATASWGPNRLDVFARGQDNGIWHMAWTGTSWTGWTSLGGVVMSAPEVSSWGEGRLDVFVQGQDNGLWHASGDGSSWSAWQSLGGSVTSNPSAVSWGPNRIDVFARGSDNALWHLAWNGSGWSAWQSLGGSLSSGPAAASCAAGHLDVFALGAGGATFQLGWTAAGWTSWQSLGGSAVSGPGAECRAAAGVADVFQRGTDNALWHREVIGS